MNFEHQAKQLAASLPAGRPLAIVGSTSFWHAKSQAFCQALGQMLAALPGLILLTGGVAGIGEATGRSFHEARQHTGLAGNLFHILPHGMPAWDYGQTLYSGQDMAERRAVLARMASIYIIVEGGPATMDEVRIALANGALLIPLAISGACAAEIYPHVTKPAFVAQQEWDMLADDNADILKLAQIVTSMVSKACSV